MKRVDIQSLVGRKIDSVLVTESIDMKKFHVFLVFCDGAYAEFYSSQEISVSSPKDGNAVEYAHKIGCEEVELFQ